MSSVTEQLKDLAVLLDRGLITRADFDQQKARLMSADSASETWLPTKSSESSSPSMPKSVGSYLISGQLGQGGMGTVYRARHRSNTFAERQGGDVAIKVLHRQYASRDDIVKRFEREAELGVKLEHPGIVRVVEFLVDGGQVALVMELVEGQALDKLSGRSSGPLAWEQVRPLFQQLLDAVGYAHEHDVVHRDLKPENIIVDAQDRTKILDFGIAKDLGSDKTKTGTGMGTVHYMAPEQYLDAKAVDQRADIYALGIILYELMAGRLPWDRTDTEYGILEQKKHGNLPSPTSFCPDIPPVIVEAIRRATATDIDERYSSIADFSDALSATQTASHADRAQGTETDDLSSGPTFTGDVDPRTNVAGERRGTVIISNLESQPPAPQRTGTIISPPEPIESSPARDAVEAPVEAAAPPADSTPGPAHDEPPSPTVSAPPSPPSPPQSGGGGQVILFIFLGLLSLGALGAGAWFFLDLGTGSSSSKRERDDDDKRDRKTIGDICSELLRSSFDHDFSDKAACRQELESGNLGHYQYSCSRSDYQRLLDDLYECVADSSHEDQLEPCADSAFKRIDSRCELDRHDEFDTGWVD